MTSSFFFDASQCLKYGKGGLNPISEFVRMTKCTAMACGAYNTVLPCPAGPDYCLGTNIASPLHERYNLLHIRNSERVAF